MRLFYAVELPEPTRAALGRLEAAQGTAGADAYRWVDPSLLHVTLAFVGERPETELEQLRRVGESAAGQRRAFELALGEAGHFGSPRAPRVLWVGLAGDLAALELLQAALSNCLRVAGYPVEERRFSPHITLARRRERARPGGPVPWPPRRSAAASSFAVKELVLMLSELSPGGPRYTVLERFGLA